MHCNKVYTWGKRDVVPRLYADVEICRKVDFFNVTLLVNVPAAVQRVHPWGGPDVEGYGLESLDIAGGKITSTTTMILKLK